MYMMYIVVAQTETTAKKMRVNAAIYSPTDNAT